MKIIFLEAVQTYGGARKSTIELAKNLNDENEILIVDAWGCCKEFIDEVRNHKLNYKILNPRKDPITLEANSKFDKLVKIGIFLKENSILKKSLKRVISEFNPTIIIVNNQKTLSLLEKSENYKIVFFAREWMLPQQISYYNKYLLQMKVDKFISVSEATRHALYAGGIADLCNISVVPNSIVISSNSKPKFDTPLTMIHCGGFLPTKGQITVLEIAKELKRFIPDFKIYLVGIIYTSNLSKRYLDKLKELISMYGLENHIEIIINSKNLDEIYKECKILLHPSDTEGLPRVVMEAMANKLAVIANPVGGVNDFILNGYTGFLTDYNDVNSYVEKILELNNNNELFNSITTNAYNLIKENYTSELQIKKFHKTLLKINNE